MSAHTRPTYSPSLAAGLEAWVPKYIVATVVHPKTGGPGALEPRARGSTVAVELLVAPGGHDEPACDARP